MPPETRRKNLKEKKNKESSDGETENVEIKEKRPLKMENKVKNDIMGAEQYDINSDASDQFDRLLSSPLKQNVNLKPLSFWSKKLKDLEPTDTTIKKTKHRLYDFSTSEDSFIPNKRKRKPVKKYQVGKKKITGFQMNSKKNINAAEGSKINSLPKGIKEKERKEVIDKKGKYAYTKVMPSLFLTSTPVINKAKLDSSNFLYLSPIEKLNKADLKENENNENHALYKLNVGTPKISNLKMQKVENNSNENKCIRVLRSRKIHANVK